MITSAKERIMIVEDDLSTYEKIKRILDKAGYETSDYLPSVRAAKDDLQKKRPDLVLIDIELQGEHSGHVLAAELKEKYYLPFIYLSRYDDRETIKAAGIFQPKAFLSKKLMKILNFLGNDETENVRREELRSDLVADKSASFGFKDILLQNITLALTEYKKNGIWAMPDYPENLRHFPEKNRHKLFHFHEVLYLTTEDMKGRTLSENFVRLGLEPEEFWIIKTSLSQIRKQLPPYFQRINQQYIVNLLHSSVRYFTYDKPKYYLVINELELPVSSTYRNEFKHKIKEYFLTYRFKEKN